MQIQIRLQKNLVILALGGSLDSPENSARLGAAIADCLFYGYPTILIDCAHSRRLGDAALNGLLNAHIEAKRAGGAIRLLHPELAAANLMVLAKLMTVFDTFDTEDEAIAGYRRPPAAYRNRVPPGGHPCWPCRGD